MSIIPVSWMPSARMDRIICHWTAGGYAVSAIDREHYHVIIGGDAKPVRGDKPISANAAPIRGDYAAHTLNCNSGSIGISVGCMAGAVEQPFAAGSAPMKLAQWYALVLAVADLCRAYAIPVTPRTVLSHAEVQGTLGIKQRGKWDISRLAFDPSIVGAKACGDRLRREVSAILAKPIPVSTPAPRLAAVQEPASMSTVSVIATAVAKAVTAAAASPSIDVGATAVAPVTAAVTAAVEPVIDHLTNNEPWYRSRVTWGAIISAAVPILGAFGIATDWIKPDEFAAGIVAIGAVVGAVTTLYGRWKARTPIGA